MVYRKTHRGTSGMVKGGSSRKSSESLSSKVVGMCRRRRLLGGDSEIMDIFHIAGGTV